MALKDDASLALIPVAYKEDKLYSVIPNDNDGDFDYSGGTNGTRVNSAGLIETVAADTPRLDYPLLDGVVQGCPTVLTEPQRTNLVLYSEDYGNSSWIKLNGTVITNSTISVDGSLNADYFIPNTTSGIHALRSNLFNQSSTASHSWFVKANGYSKVAVRESELVGNYATFDLSSGTIISTNQTGKIIDYGNGWYRLTLIDTTTGTNAQTSIVVLPDSYAGGNPILNWSGDGVKGVYVFGAQVELGNYPTSYIKTTTPQVTRSADDCVDAGTAADFNDSEGVFYVNAKINDPSEADNNDFSLGDGSFVSNSVEISFKNLSASSQSIVGSCVIDGSSLSITPTTITDASIKHDLFHKVAYQYKQADFKMFVNGFKIGTSTYNNIFPSGALQRVSFEGNGTANTKFRGNTREVMTFNTAMTDAQMEELTSYESFNQMAKQQLYTIE